MKGCHFCYRSIPEDRIITVSGRGTILYFCCWGHMIDDLYGDESCYPEWRDL